MATRRRTAKVTQYVGEVSDALDALGERLDVLRDAVEAGLPHASLRRLLHGYPDFLDKGACALDDLRGSLGLPSTAVPWDEVRREFGGGNPTGGETWLRRRLDGLSDPGESSPPQLRDGGR